MMANRYLNHHLRHFAVALWCICLNGSVGEASELPLKPVKVVSSKGDPLAALGLRVPIVEVVDEADWIVFRDRPTGDILTKIRKKKRVELTPQDKEILEQRGKHELIVKINIAYIIPESANFLLVSDYRVVFHSEEEAEGTAFRHVVYNKTGRKIRTLSAGENGLIGSPVGTTFVTRTVGEVAYTEYVRLYDGQGEPLLKYPINSESFSIRYSYSGSWIFVHDLDRQLIHIFDERGLRERRFNYGHLVDGDRYKRPFRIFSSDDGNHLLLSFMDMAVLLNAKGEEIWRVSSKRIIECRFNVRKGFVLFYRAMQDGRLQRVPKLLEWLSLRDGKLKGTLEHVKLEYIDREKIAISKGNKFSLFAIASGQ